jgi:hypothetical protein
MGKDYKQMRVSNDLQKLIDEINKLRKINGLKALSGNKFTKIICNKIKKENILYKQIIYFNNKKRGRPKRS